MSNKIKSYLIMCGFTYCEELSCYINKQYFYELDIKSETLKKGVLYKGRFKPVVKKYKHQIALRFIIEPTQSVWDPRKVWLIDNQGKRIIPKHECSQISFNLNDIEKFLLEK